MLFRSVIIAGAGIAGVLAANRLCQTLEHANILIIDKSPFPGGRIQAVNHSEQIWGGGLSYLSKQLIEYIQHSITLDPDSAAVPDFFKGRMNTGAILAAGKFQEFPLSECFSTIGAKALGGKAAAQTWAQFEKIFTADANAMDKKISRVWKDGKKSPAAAVMEHLSSLVGMVDVWQASPQSLKERIDYLHSGLYTGPWEDILDLLLQAPLNSKKLEQIYSCRIITASQQEDLWNLTTEKGLVKGKSLLVAQSPWHAAEWLQHADQPTPVLQLALKSKPTSAVNLNLKLKDPCEIPDLIYVPAEGVQIIQRDEKTLCFQTFIDFEHSLDAPSVLKAIKRLKRARKKIQIANASISGEDEHLALISVAWPLSAHVNEQKLLDKLKDPQNFQSKHLSFCGDSYGGDYSPDTNLVKSLTSACTTINAQQATEHEG